MVLSNRRRARHRAALLAAILAAGHRTNSFSEWARRSRRVWEFVAAAHFRYRAQLRPLLGLAVLVVAATAAASIDPVRAFVTSVLVSFGVVFYLRRRLTRAAEWAYAGTCLVGATLVLCVVSLVGVGNRWMDTVGVLGWAALSLRWWLHHQVRAAASELAPIVELWNEHVRGGQGPMAKARLTGPVPFEHGATYTVELVPYRQTLAKAQADTPNWVTALDVPMDRMVLEKHPDFPKSQRLLRLQIITRSPIENTVYFDCPRCEDGLIMLGPYADGVGEAFLRLYTENSMWSTFVLGGTGIGKSRMLEQIAISVLSRGDTIVFYMDGQNGASSPTLFRHADWPVGPDGALRMLAALERAAAWRQKENRAYGLDGFTPSPERPGILVIVDEQHRIVPLAAPRFADASVEWRKIGQSLLGADQDSSLKTTFSGEDRLRSAMLGGNGFVMNVQSRIAGNLIPGLEINPADLPRIPGYAVSVAAEGSGARTAPFRNRYAPNEKEKAKAEARGVVVPVPTIEEWFARYPQPVMDRGTARAMGQDYTERHTRAAREREALLRVVNGDHEPTAPQALPDLDEPGVLAASPDDAETLREATRIEAERSMTCAQRILGLDWSRYGEMNPGQVLAELPPGTKLDTMRKALRKLVDDGELGRTGRGAYERTR